jgi:hypothetical protein
MDEGDWLAERFQAQRPRLRAVAYRLLGSLSEADAGPRRGALVPAAPATNTPVTDAGRGR